MVARKLIFYRWMTVNSQPEFVPHEAVQRLREVIDAKPSEAVLTSKETCTGIHVIQPGDGRSPAFLRLLALRSKDNRPAQWEIGGELEPLPLLESQYLTDYTHVAIWPNGYAAQDLHNNAPRLGRLSAILRAKALAHVSFEPLYRADMYERLKRIQGRLRSVSFALTKPERLDHRDSFGTFSTLIPSAWGEKAPSISVTIGTGAFGPKDRSLDGEIEKALLEIAENAYDNVDSLRVSGFNPTTRRVEKINLLSERIQEEVDLPESSKDPSQPDSAATLRALESAYTTLLTGGTLEEALQAQIARLG